MLPAADGDDIRRVLPPHEAERLVSGRGASFGSFAAGFCVGYDLAWLLVENVECGPWNPQSAMSYHIPSGMECTAFQERYAPETSNVCALRSDQRVPRRGTAIWMCCALALLPIVAVGGDPERPIPATLSRPEGEATNRIQLVSAEFPAETWQFFSGKKGTTLSDTWRVELTGEELQPVIICRGEPYGYIRTRRRFRNFEMGWEWKFPQDANGNSGVLLFTTGEDRLWPTSIQVELHQPAAGSTFPSGGARVDEELRDVPMLSKPVNEWNRCVVHCVNGCVKVVLNGETVGTVTGCEPREGAIALQSQGAEVHFRNIWIRELQADESGQHSAGVSRIRRPFRRSEQRTRSLNWRVINTGRQ